MPMDDSQPWLAGRVSLCDPALDLRKMRVFATLTEEELSSLGEADLLEVPAEGTIYSLEMQPLGYCVLQV